jgi:heme-degrading monooxygenase HmoA
MMTIVTRVALKEASAPEWDAAMRARLEAAQHQPGWIGAQLLIPLESLNKRVLIGTWVSGREFLRQGTRRRRLTSIHVGA